jgi:hypothetical protein
MLEILWDQRIGRRRVHNRHLPEIVGQE